MNPVKRPFVRAFSFFSLGFKSLKPLVKFFTNTPPQKQTRYDNTPSAGLSAGLSIAAPQAILRPVNPFFILFSLICASALNLSPWGAIAWMPDFLALVLVFWNVREPRLLGMGWAFAMGLVMDVHEAAVLGEHALAYTLMSYGAIAMHRRLAWFGGLHQAVQIAPVFFVAQGVAYVVRSFFGGSTPSWMAYILAPLFTVALWPIARWVLTMPQRRPQEIDQVRPI